MSRGKINEEVHETTKSHRRSNQNGDAIDRRLSSSDVNEVVQGTTLAHPLPFEGNDRELVNDLDVMDHAGESSSVVDDVKGSRTESIFSSYSSQRSSALHIAKGMDPSLQMNQGIGSPPNVINGSMSTEIDISRLSTERGEDESDRMMMEGRNQVDPEPIPKVRDDFDAVAHLTRPLKDERKKKTAEKEQTISKKAFDIKQDGERNKSASWALNQLHYQFETILSKKNIFLEQAVGEEVLSK